MWLKHKFHKTQSELFCICHLWVRGLSSDAAVDTIELAVLRAQPDGNGFDEAVLLAAAIDQAATRFWTE